MSQKNSVKWILKSYWKVQRWEKWLSFEDGKNKKLCKLVFWDFLSKYLNRWYVALNTEVIWRQLRIFRTLRINQLNFTISVYHGAWITTFHDAPVMCRDLAFQSGTLGIQLACFAKLWIRTWYHVTLTHSKHNITYPHPECIFSIIISNT